MRLLFREGLPKNGQAAGAFAEHPQADGERLTIERSDRRLVGQNTGPVDALSLWRLHHRHCPSNDVATQTRCSTVCACDFWRSGLIRSRLPRQCHASPVLRSPLDSTPVVARIRRAVFGRVVSLVTLNAACSSGPAMATSPRRGLQNLLLSRHRKFPWLQGTGLPWPQGIRPSCLPYCRARPSAIPIADSASERTSGVTPVPSIRPEWKA